jgi:galactose mutarotase-like enzyme
MINFEIKTIKEKNGNEVSFSPSRGGMITSLKFIGKEILYFDEETFLDKEKSVRGGIPILFPNAGELEKNDIFPNLKRHGFAKSMEWKLDSREFGFKESLIFNNDTKNVYPFDFNLSVVGNFEEDGSFTFVQEVKNSEEGRELPISMGLHPYFKVLDEEKKDIRFNFKGGIIVKEQMSLWENSGTVYIDNPKIKDPNATVNIDIPRLGTLILDISIEYKKIWIWSIPKSDFICIEPMMRGLNGLINDPLKVKIDEPFVASVNIKLK